MLIDKPVTERVSNWTLTLSSIGNTVPFQLCSNRKLRILSKCKMNQFSLLFLIEIDFYPRNESAHTVE